MMGANTPEDCTDFDRDAEIWVVGFRARLMACARSGGQAGGNLKSPPGCTYFSLDAEILGRPVPRATVAVREASRSLVQGAGGQIRFSGAPWCACRLLRARPSRSQFCFVEGWRQPEKSAGLHTF